MKKIPTAILALVLCAIFSSTVAAQEFHDVAISYAYAWPYQALQGEPVAVNYTASNYGNFTESGVAVRAKDLTDNVEICVQYYALDPGAYIQDYCIWDTSGASIGNHTIEVRADPVPGETYTANNVRIAPASIVELPVYDGYISSLSTDKPRYIKRQTVYTTAVVQNTGNRVLDAKVRATYIRPDQSVAYTEEKAVSVPVSGSSNVQSSYVLPAAPMLGTWTVKAELIYGAATLDTKTAPFEVVKRL